MNVIKTQFNLNLFLNFHLKKFFLKKIQLYSSLEFSMIQGLKQDTLAYPSETPQAQANAENFEFEINF